MRFGRARPSRDTWADRSRTAWGRDRGEVTSELAIATPLLLLALLAITQFTLWSHATHVAQAAASHALSATRVQFGTSAVGHAAGWRVLNELGHGPLRQPRLDITRTATEATVRVHGEAAAVLPGVRLPVHAEASGAVERFVPDSTVAS